MILALHSRALAAAPQFRFNRVVTRGRIAARTTAMATSAPPTTIAFATGNKKKLEEVIDEPLLYRFNVAPQSPSTLASVMLTACSRAPVQVVAILAAGADLPFAVESVKLDLPELQGWPEDIAKEKCRLAAKQVGGAVMTEDTSLCFNALGGLPGPYIKWFLEKCGHEGLNKMLGAATHPAILSTCPSNSTHTLTPPKVHKPTM
jgi:inosine/xanthosine triphosphate pyrophosphatase family protein